MNKEYFTENISEENLAKLTDRMLKFEKSNKNSEAKMLLLRIIPAAAAFVFILRFVNFMVGDIEKRDYTDMYNNIAPEPFSYYIAENNPIVKEDAEEMFDYPDEFAAAMIAGIEKDDRLAYEITEWGEFRIYTLDENGGVIFPELPSESEYTDKINQGITHETDKNGYLFVYEFDAEAVKAVFERYKNGGGRQIIFPRKYDRLMTSLAWSKDDTYLSNADYAINAYLDNHFENHFGTVLHENVPIEGYCPHTWVSIATATEYEDGFDDSSPSYLTERSQVCYISCADSACLKLLLAVHNRNAPAYYNDDR